MIQCYLNVFEHYLDSLSCHRWYLAHALEKPQRHLNAGRNLLRFISCVNLSKLPNVSELHFPVLLNKNNNVCLEEFT